MIRVHLITEDRTGGGLDEVVQACVQAQRAESGKGPLGFSRMKGNVDGAAQLLKQCEKYELYRFNYSPRFDHVFYVIDARNAWRLPQLGVSAPEPPLSQSLPSFLDKMKKGMEAIGRGLRTQDEWARIAEGFHPHVLVWERESLILPVADRLGLGDAVHDVYGERQAAENLSQRLRRLRNRKYDKAIHGPQFLGQIARDASLRAVVLDSNPSLRALVHEMVAL
ncbi:MAG TPA: hypothetical protein VF815_17365 [Myxococcaceae bacterium]|jgi:hypothetical protein